MSLISSESSHRFLPLGRAQAFVAHLALSLLVFSSLGIRDAVLVVPRRVVLPRWRLARAQVGSDGRPCVGPGSDTRSPTSRGKPNLAVDMSLIAIVQIVALVYGFVTTYQQRTVAMVYAEGRFSSVSATHIERATADLNRLGVEPVEISMLLQDSEKAGATAPVPLLTTPVVEGDAFAPYFAELLNGFPPMQERSDRYTVLGGKREASNFKRVESGVTGATSAKSSRNAAGKRLIDPRYRRASQVRDPLRQGHSDLGSRVDADPRLCPVGRRRIQGHGGGSF